MLELGGYLKRLENFVVIIKDVISIGKYFYADYIYNWK